MPKAKNQRSLLTMLSVFLFVIISTIIVSAIARGYQISFRSGNFPTLKATGLLSASSRPKGASVFLNDRLVTATDDTLNLPPGDYNLKITKDGFLPWIKNIHIQKEVVFQAEAQLFRSAPDLKPITVSGAIHPTISPDYSKIVFSVASASATKDNGLYLVELSSSPLPLTRNSPRQIATNLPNIDWSKATFTFSPNSQQILATFPSGNHYLLNLNQTITYQQLYDVTPSLPIIAKEWQELEQSIIATKLDRIPPSLTSLISTGSAKNIAYSSTEDKLLYLAKGDGTLPQHLITPPPSQNNQPQARSIQKDNFYVYDLKDDTNYLLGPLSAIQNPAWLPNSNNLIFVQGDSIKTIEYDSTNQQTIFAGKFDTSVVYPWSDGSRIITLTSPYTGATQNLYTVTIR